MILESIHFWDDKIRLRYVNAQLVYSIDSMLKKETYR